MCSSIHLSSSSSDRREGGRAQYAETAGLADRRDHVAAMAEGDQREIDAQHFADRIFHLIGFP